MTLILCFKEVGRVFRLTVLNSLILFLKMKQAISNENFMLRELAIIMNVREKTRKRRNGA